MEPCPLLEDLDGWVLGCLEEGLSHNEAWQQLARVVVTPMGKCLYSASDLSRLKSTASPAETLLRQLVQRGISQATLLQLLQAANLVHLYALLAPPETAAIVSQSATGLLSIEYGSNLSLSVQVKGNPPPLLVWYRGNTPLLHHTGNTLSIPHFGPQDEGIYLCLVRQQQHEQSNGSLTAGDPQYVELWSDPIEVCLKVVLPSFAQQPQDCLVNWGGQVTLSCNVSPATYPPPIYTWYRGGALLCTTDAPLLKVSRADGVSAGQYWCVAHNIAGEDTSRRATVSVRGSSDGSSTPTILRQPSVAVTTTTTTTVTTAAAGKASDGCVGYCDRGQPLQLWCTVRCAAPVTFTWTRGGVPLAGSSGPSHAVVSSSEAPDGGVYSSSLLYTPTEEDVSPLRLLCIAASPAAQVASNEVVIHIKKTDITNVVYTARRKWAMLVGNRRYEGRPLHTTLPDCQRIAGELTIMGFRCLVLADLALTHFRNAVAMLAGLVEEGDYVVFYYGGHGYHEGGDRIIPTDGCGERKGNADEDSVVVGDCLSPTWVRNVLLRRCPALLLLVLDMCRTVVAADGPPPPAAPLPAASRCSVVLHATAVSCAALEAPSSTSVLARHLLRRLRTHAGSPVTELAAAVLRDVCGESNRVREQQYPVLEVDLALPRTLADASTAPPGAPVLLWEKLLGVGGRVRAEVLLHHPPNVGTPNNNEDQQVGARGADRSENSSAQTNNLNLEKSSCIPGTVSVQPSANVLPSTSGVPSTVHCPPTAPTRARVWGEALLLSEGGHPVANIASVAVAVHWEGCPGQCSVRLIAPGCRIQACREGGEKEPWRYRVEDLHCLTAPIVAVVSLSLISGGKTHVTDNLRVFSPWNPLSHLNDVAASSSSRMVRLSLGYPGLAKTNLHLNDLQGDQLEDEEDCEGSTVAVERLNIALP